MAFFFFFSQRSFVPVLRRKQIKTWEWQTVAIYTVAMKIKKCFAEVNFTATSKTVGIQGFLFWKIPILTAE